MSGRREVDGYLDGMTMAELHQRFAGPLLVFANRSVGDAELAREIVNDTLLRAWRHAHRFDPEKGELATWLFAIARNLAIDAGRRRLARPAVVRDIDDVEVAEDAAVDRILEAWEIADALRSLQPAHQAVIIEVHYRGASIAETADRLGIPEGTVKSRLYYGLRGLRLALEERGVMG